MTEIAYYLGFIVAFNNEISVVKIAGRAALMVNMRAGAVYRI
jgi:hypothetical protein